MFNVPTPPYESPNQQPIPLLKRRAGRFAPTPTGALHVGNGYTALLAHLCARHFDHASLLRVDDLDVRALPSGCLEAQLEDLSWLGIEYDESPALGGPAGPYRQSERGGVYSEALRQLNDQGLLYPCDCSRKEIAALAPHAQDEGVIYPGVCRPEHPAPISLDDLPQERGRPPALRLNLHEAVKRRQGSHIEWIDHIAGPQSFHLLNAVGDFVVRRGDGVFAYQLACAVDDLLQGCALILRGDDLLTSTARQLMIMELIGVSQDHRPAYAHVGLVVDAQGERLAKRAKSTQLSGLRAAGHSPYATRESLSVAWGGPPTGDLDLLIERFKLSSLPTGPVCWSPPS